MPDLTLAATAISVSELTAVNLTALGFQNSLDAATHYINAKYDSLGGAGGSLGAPDGNITVCPDGIGYFRHYWNNGSIYWTPSTGAIAVHGSIREKWASLQWERGFLGYPVHDEVAGNNPHTAGSGQAFQGGCIFTYFDSRLVTTTVGTLSPIAIATAQLDFAPPRAALSIATTASRLVTTAAQRRPAAPAHTSIPVAEQIDAVRGSAVVGILQRPPKPSITTTHEVHGAILAKYLELGAEASILGYPTTDETGTPDNIGKFNHFQAGSIYWTPSTGAHEVHGLIRDYWSAHGWERNAALGYPLSDELIPDRRIGHVRPETTRKPIVNLPSDMLRLPVEAAASGAVLRSGVNVVRDATRFAGTEITATNTGVLGGLLLSQPASTPAPQGSVNRFADFESGVLFWQRGAAAAKEVTPWVKAADGTQIQKTAADILAATLGHLGSSLQLPGGAAVPVSAGVTSTYSWDGAGTQNRRHQIQVNITALENTGPFGTPIPHIHSVMLFVLVTFEPERRKIVAYLADYATGDPVFAARLDPLLWSPYDILIFPDTNDGKPYSILSVKTMANGFVNTYIEPASLLVATTGISTTATTATAHIAERIR